MLSLNLERLNSRCNVSTGDSGCQYVDRVILESQYVK